MRLATMLGSMAVLALAATGCSDETAPTHNPVVAARLVVGGTEVIDEGETLTLTAGETVEIEVLLLDEQGDVVGDIEDHHYVKLNFTPAGLATSVNVGDRHFLKSVTVQGTTGGTLDIGYGHSEAANEHSFGTFDVEILPPPCVCAVGVSSKVM